MLFRVLLSSLVLGSAFASSSVRAEPVYGDRNVPMEIVLPERAFKSNNSRGTFLNIKDPPFNAKGDGVTDDTQAFITALNFLRDKLNEMRGGGERGGHSYHLYLPKGTYLVSDSLVHEGNMTRGFCYLRIWGQDRRDTVIKLKDNAPGFGDPSKPKPVLPWSKLPEAQGNIMWGNHARNFTIDTGRGNPGAVGMTFMAANISSMENITIRSGDGTGAIGLWFPWWSVQGHFCDITVEGFDYGIRFDDLRENQPTLEYVTLKGQKRVGLEVGPAMASVRKLWSQNSVPAITMNGKVAQLVLLDSLLEGGSPAAAAIEFNNSSSQQLFARNVEIKGYGIAIARDGQPAVKGRIDEFVSGEVVTLNSLSPKKSMNLTIPEVKLIPWETDLTKWADPEQFTGTVEEKIQAALNSGKPVVGFTRTYSSHLKEGEFIVPPTVEQIVFLGQDVILRSPLVIKERSEKPLFIDGCSQGPEIRFEAPRETHIRNGGVTLTVATKEPVIVQAQNVCELAGSDRPEFCPPGARIYVRSVNDESRTHTNFSSSGGVLWVMGYKTEADQSAFVATNGGVIEVLGGYQNMAATPDSGKPKVFNDESHVSYVGTTFMSRQYKNAIWEKRGGQLRKVLAADLPPRATSPGNYFVPLYTGYNPAVVKAKAP